jgi:glyoxylase-like metal-dependent hydrolase (beta-lactamase superfamily II)
MERRQFLASAGLSGLALAIRPESFSRTLSTAEGFTELRRGAGIFEDRGGTIGWLVTAEGTVVVDTQFADTAAVCLEGIRSRSQRDIDVVINTHHHGDHTGGNAVFAPVARQLVGHWNVPGLQREAAQRGGSAEVPVVPRTTFRDEWRMDLRSATVSAVHMGPAHTGGDIVVFFEEAGVVHMGDLVFNRRPPFIDRPGGASISGWIDVLEQSHERFVEDTLFVFGHAGAGHPVVGKRDDLLAMRDYLYALLTYATEQRTAGKSEEGAAQAVHVPGFESWGVPDRPQAVQANIRAAYQEVAG